jgi:acetyltransferase
MEGTKIYKALKGVRGRKPVDIAALEALLVRFSALAAVRRDPETGESEIPGVGRMMKILGGDEGEVAVLISDKWQGRGLGKELLSRLVVVGGDEKLAKLCADILPDNRDVMRICEKIGFSLKHSAEDDVVRAEYKL